MKINTTTIAGTATLAALAVILDYSLKYSYLKIQFPWMPSLKFDFTGIPIVLSMLMFGLVPGAITTVVASVGILARSGNIVGSSMKGLAEFSAIAGMAIGFKLFSRFANIGASAFGILSRVSVMIVANIALIHVGLLPVPTEYANLPVFAALLTAVFNIMQGGLSIGMGLFIYKAVKRRALSVISRNGNQDVAKDRTQAS